MSNDNNGTSAKQCAREEGIFVQGQTKVYTCPCGLYGRYVRIRFSSAASIFDLCELQVQPGGKQNKHISYIVQEKDLRNLKSKKKAACTNIFS